MSDNGLLDAFMQGINADAQTKTVADAVEYFGGVWPESKYFTAWWDSETNQILLGDNITSDTICTREQFEAYVKEQEGDKWTHTWCGQRCKIVHSDGNASWIIVENRGSEVVFTIGLNPIKPTMTKEQHEFLCKFSADSNSLEVIAEVESYLAKHDII